MATRLKPLHQLRDDQARAADPAIHASLSASAGTGKTQVLTARVLRLLLGGAAPEHILCLTFTKAGAAEMANRIGERLARWVRMKDADLRKELFAIGAPNDDPRVEQARRLFAEVLDAPGGLRIQTIHSFAQTLLAAFPAEAGITPGFRPIEGREEQQLARRTLAGLVADAEAGRAGYAGLLTDIQALSRRLGEREAERYLLSCAREPEAMRAFAFPDYVEQALRSQLGLPEGDIRATVAAACHDDSFDCEVLRAVAEGYRAWGTTATGLPTAAKIDEWLALSSDARCEQLDTLMKVLFTATGRRKVPAGVLKHLPTAGDHCEQLADEVERLVTLLRQSELVAVQAAGLRAGAAFADAYTRAKRAAGVADFDDLIRWTRDLLATPGMGEWVRYKLDRRTDHILVDEAQDTNAAQWSIVTALTEEFFAGEGASRHHRTLFMVGDFKQAIYGFQGTDPREFDAARERFRIQAETLREAANDSDTPVRPWRDLSIDRSFRSAQAVLDVVDAVITEVGAAEMGLPDQPNPHRANAATRPGLVELWTPFAADEGEDEEAGEEGWLPEPARLYAGELARTVRRWLGEAPVLATTGKPITPGDVLILVRSRGELASLIVARLFKEGVPVAGIDRLHLSSPLAVKDLMAAVAFSVQPLDDLNLAGLLVSPLFGWTQDQLYDLAFGRNGFLWEELRKRAGEGDHIAEAHATLLDLLRQADFVPPARYLENILSGPMQGRRRLLGRLGPAARDPIDELVAAALEFERAETPSLDRFLAWFGSGDVEIKRDPSAPANAVRVMTVHGAKGLEAPVVILADATADPAKLGERNGPIALDFGEAGNAPVIRPRKEELGEPYATIIAEQKRRDLEEHWRLLYVALTRAAERLVVAGLAPARGALPENSWHAKVRAGMERLGAEQDGSVLRYTGDVPALPAKAKTRRLPLPPPALPEFLHRQAPAEARPPRPLAPSQLVEDREAAPPPSPELRAAARRGVLLHSLFERLPGVAPAERHAAALGWLERSAGVDDPRARIELADAVCAIIGDARFADLFAPGSLAEAPIAATLPDGRVVAGTVDRLVVDDERVRVVDFKTGRQVPASVAEVPAAHRLQMEAYGEALSVIFPGRRIETALLYTAAPRLIALTG
ncbi:double-strand break repair helicase AddA [Sphingomonas sp. BN140010]|uniref:DNA 3'-5' helicase n=1 Tax=Sphingomonas arvum TaxID=2992113 RepID=A0ABT3JDS3_9SPHN|nr:double-strand break repair helicase AddA [Sphingomonas sp. BN140010]MCW3797059.1 double-strand break repair helicase AddA [Sphingomonas sp. BN140010]